MAALPAACAACGTHVRDTVLRPVLCVHVHAHLHLHPNTPPPHTHTPSPCQPHLSSSTKRDVMCSLQKSLLPPSLPQHQLYSTLYTGPRTKSGGLPTSTITITAQHGLRTVAVPGLGMLSCRFGRCCCCGSCSCGSCSCFWCTGGSSSMGCAVAAVSCRSCCCCCAGAGCAGPCCCCCVAMPSRHSGRATGCFVDAPHSRTSDSCRIAASCCKLAATATGCPFCA